MKTSTFKNYHLAFAFSIAMINSYSQSIIFREDFIYKESNVNENGQGFQTGNSLLYSDFAENFSSVNGSWIIENISNGSKSNRWIVGTYEAGMGAGNCSSSFDQQLRNDNNTAYIGNVAMTKSVKESNNGFFQGNSPVDELGAFYYTAELSETNIIMRSPVINLTGKQNIKLSFEYLLGQLDPQAQFTVSYFNGSTWVDLPALSNTFSETCPAPRTSMWASSPEFTLPATVNNISNFQIGFRFTSTPDGEGSTPKVSVAIDNIVISGSDIAASGGGTASDLRMATEKPVTIEDPKKSIQFTVYPNPNSGQFTVDFTGVENNHEVQILLCDTRTGKILYSTTFQSNSIDHNKVDIQPTERVEPGRYICALVCEGIRLNSTVIIH